MKEKQSIFSFTYNSLNSAINNKQLEFLLRESKTGCCNQYLSSTGEDLLTTTRGVLAAVVIRKAKPSFFLQLNPLSFWLLAGS